LSNDEATLSVDPVDEKRVNTTDEDFIATWQANTSVETVASLLGMKAGSVEQRARNMRNHGVSLVQYEAKVRTVKDDAYWATMNVAALAAAPSSDKVDTDN